MTTSKVDFFKFDNRDSEEKGQLVQLCDPNTREPLESEGKPCSVLLRLPHSHSFQSLVRDRLRSSVVSTDDDKQGDIPGLAVLEDTHNTLIDAALPFIIRFENVYLTEKGELVEVGSDEALIRRLLDFTFPIFGKLEDSEEMGMLNWPFASQILDASQKSILKLGK